MSVIDPIADMLTRVRNAYQALHQEVLIPRSNVKLAIAGIMKEEGYIADFSDEGRNIRVVLKYADGRPLIEGLKRISKPGRRVYVASTEIPRVQNGLGICVLSTSHGVLEGNVAKEKNVGGELLFEIW
ncbi:small subunit ribosomal protein S8 [Desulfobaculum xiamenense]|uniref:Small ribosomal subunit protein uS8 n=1 Tax=Desulfobaculum xiamenense TaxID=995050 RepID=A0A846QSH0_9BACT|nr:30S ribosomal protein S8 [Desulfobaculum xiamenense]NJB69482.1 small subunit ribosomal protein S8 [Desulfobaculum xiamenense]